MRKIRIVSSARGQSLMEISLMLPMLLIIVFGIVDFGLGMRSYISLSSGVREAARFAAIGNPAGAPADCDGMTSTTVYGALCAATDGLDFDELEPHVTYPNGYASGNSVVVSADYSHNFVTPLSDLIGFFSGGAFPTSIELHSSTDMRIE